MQRALVPASIIPSQLSKQERGEALRRIDEYFARVDSQRGPVSEEEEDAIFVEAMQSIRPNYRPME